MAGTVPTWTGPLVTSSKDSTAAQTGTTRPRPAIFLDRDGTLNVDRCITYREDQFELIDGVSEGLRLLRLWGFDLVVITNQSGIGRGDYRYEDMARFNGLLIRALDHVHLSHTDFYYCPHDPVRETCTCCKPNPGMLLQASRDRSIDLARSYMIGDKISDVVAGQRAGCRTTILVRTGITDDRKRYNARPDYVAQNLLEAAHIVGEVEGMT